MSRINDSNVLYLDPNKNRTREWFQARGNVVPLGGTRFGFIRRIAQPDDSVKFSLRAPIENSGNLIAVHNLTEEKLKKALKLGGFPMPSIAIAKTDIGHQNFGGISLVFGKDTIDPKADRKNKVYSADVWSPTFPRIEYEVNAKVENRVRETLNDLGDRMETYLREQLKRVVYGIDEYLNRFEGEEGFVDWAVNNYGLKAAFLEDQGQHVGMVKVEKPVGKSYPEGAATVFQQIIDLFGGDMESAQKLPLTQIREEYGAELERIRPGVTSSALRLSGMIRHAAEYQQQAGQPMQYKAVEDYSATERSIDERIDPSAFKGYTIKQCMSAINGAFGKSADVYRTLEKYNSRDAGVLLNQILDAYEALGLNRQEEIEWIDANWPKLD